MGVVAVALGIRKGASPYSGRAAHSEAEPIDMRERRYPRCSARPQATGLQALATGLCTVLQEGELARVGEQDVDVLESAPEEAAVPL